MNRLSLFRVQRGSAYSDCLQGIKKDAISNASAKLQVNKKPRTRIACRGSRLVGVTGFEPAASTSQMSRATNCATPRFFNKQNFYAVTMYVLYYYIKK